VWAFSLDSLPTEYHGAWVISSTVALTPNVVHRCDSLTVNVGVVVTPNSTGADGALIIVSDATMVINGIISVSGKGYSAGQNALGTVSGATVTSSSAAQFYGSGGGGGAGTSAGSNGGAQRAGQVGSFGRRQSGRGA
jgi:hypothetical protein